MIKRIVAMALALLLLLSMAACGRKEAPASDGKATALPSASPDSSSEAAAPAIRQALLDGQVFQKDSDTIGSGYGEIFYFAEDGSYFWFASQYEDQGETDHCRFQAGTWKTQNAGSGNGMELILTLQTADWLEGGTPTRKKGQGEAEHHDIHIQDGTVSIAGSPFYPVGTPLTDPRMLPWLKTYAEGELPQTEYLLGIDDMADLAAAIPAGGEGAPLGGPDVVGGSTRPIPVQPGTMIVSGLAAVDVLPWSYFTGVVEFDGDQFVVLARELPRGDLEILFSATQNVGINPTYSVDYVAGSYEQSGKTGLYFTLAGPNGMHWLYRFDLQRERTSLVLDTVCSEMVLFDKPQPDIEGLGWVLAEDKILPIRLSDGSIHEMMGNKLEDWSEGRKISNHFWAGVGAAYDTKFPILTALDNGLLGIEVVEFNSQTSAPETRIRFQYDCNMVNLWYIETVGGNDGQDCLP